MQLKSIVVNKSWGGFSLSYEGVMAYAKNKGIKLFAYVDKRDERGDLLPLEEKNRFKSYSGEEKAFIIYYFTKPLKDGDYDENSYFSESDIKRDDPALVKTVKQLKEKANGNCARLVIVKIPNDVEWEIDDYDGMETVHEKHRSW